MPCNSAGQNADYNDWKLLGRLCLAFRGKEREGNREIIRALARAGPMTTWGLTRQILLDRQSEEAQVRTQAEAGRHANSPVIRLGWEPTSREIRQENSVVYREVLSLLEKRYIRRRGLVRSKGNDVQVYGLSYRGTLAALLLPEIYWEEVDDLVMIRADSNVILTIALQLLSDGIPEAFIARLLLDGLREDLRRGYLKIDEVEREEADRILYTRFLKRLYDEREELVKDPALLRKLSKSLRSMGFPPALINLFAESLSRLRAATLWRERVAERKEFLDLFTYLVEGPRPYAKSRFRSRPRSHPL